MHWTIAVALALLVPALAGCFTSTSAEVEAPPLVTWSPCEHPWPCGGGSEWPADLVGPFERLAPARVQVASFDGVLLDGALWLPDVPEGTRLPTVLHTSPYIGQCPYQWAARGRPGCLGAPDSEARLDGSYELDLLIEDGYAVAIFSVRGTGSSGGCYDKWGPSEQRDQAALVEWLAQQEWSNGRVGMVGLSYAGTTPWEAAILAPEPLKAIVVGGIITDVYLGSFTPQGAAAEHALDFSAKTMAANSLAPPVGQPLDTLPQYAPHASERACPEAPRTFAAHTDSAMADERDAEWFAQRRLVDRFDDVRAAPLVLHGLQDNSFHRYQEDIIWGALANAPKGALLGQWGHDVGLDEWLAEYEGGKSWYELERAWFDFFLKGLGEPPATLGRVAFQDSAGAWREDVSWPPEAAREEVLFLAGEGLAREAAEGARSISLAPVPDARTDCQSASPQPMALLYETAPREEPVVLAGNPFAWLTVSADRPRGQFEVALRELSPDFTCEGAGEAVLLTEGAVDLAFHDGRMRALDFPTDTPTPVRVDFYNVAHVLEPGHRLALTIANPTDQWVGRNDAPTLTVHAGGDAATASQLVLPVVEGTFDAPAPSAAYPPRPFVGAGIHASHG